MYQNFLHRTNSSGDGGAITARSSLRALAGRSSSPAAASNRLVVVHAAHLHVLIIGGRRGQRSRLTSRKRRRAGNAAVIAVDGVITGWLLTGGKGGGNASVDLFLAVPELQAAAAWWDPKVELDSSKLREVLSPSQLLLDCELQSIVDKVDLEVEFQGTPLAARDREEVIGLVVGLDDGAGLRVVKLWLADDLELLRTVGLDGPGPLPSLKACSVVSKSRVEASEPGASSSMKLTCAHSRAAWQSHSCVKIPSTLYHFFTARPKAALSTN